MSGCITRAQLYILQMPKSIPTQFPFLRSQRGAIFLQDVSQSEKSTMEAFKVFGCFPNAFPSISNGLICFKRKGLLKKYQQ